MKKILLYTLAFASLLAVSCQKDAYEPGTPDKKDCYNVYFPEQEFSGEIEIAPDEGYDFQIELKRTKTDGNISVPLKVVCGSNPDIVTITTAEFADGDADATATLSFHNPELMKKYRIVISIVGDEYALKYSQSLAMANNSLSVDVTYAKWNTLVTGTYTSCFFGVIPVPAYLQQNDSFQEMYRIYTGALSNIQFTAEKVTPAEGDPYYELSIPKQGTGQTYGSYGEIFISDYYTYSGSTKYPAIMYEDYSIEAIVWYGVSAGTLNLNRDTFEPSAE